MQLIILQGQSATGKTTLALKLARDLGYATFLKDTYKESQFDAVGKTPNIPEWIRFEQDSWRMLYHKLGEAIDADMSLIIEGNFKSKQQRMIKKLLHPDTVVYEVFCFARGWVPLKRYVSRNRSGERHTSHRDHLWYVFVFFDILLSKFGLNRYKPLRLSSQLIRVDTTDFGKIEYTKILAFIKR